MSDDDKMSGFDCYKTWSAVTAHFNGRFDYFKYNGRVKTTENAFLARKDKYFFDKASRKFKRDEFLKYMVSNIINGNHWIGDMFSAKQEITFKKWKKRVESLTYTFKEELSYIYDKEENFNNIFMIIDGKHPLLFRLYQRGKVSLETLVILDALVNFTNHWSSVNDYVLNDVVELIHKYRPFLNHFTTTPKEKWKSIVLEIFND